jgi:hypothetical protein
MQEDRYDVFVRNVGYHVQESYVNINVRFANRFIPRFLKDNPEFVPTTRKVEDNTKRSWHAAYYFEDYLGNTISIHIHSAQDRFNDEEMNDLVSGWHDDKTYTGTLIEYLGCTWEEYADFVDGAVPTPRNEQ